MAGFPAASACTRCLAGRTLSGFVRLAGSNPDDDDPVEEIGLGQALPGFVLQVGKQVVPAGITYRSKATLK